MVGPTRRVCIAVRQWNSEEGIHTWKYCKQHLLQPKDGGPWTDLLTLVHINGTKPLRAGAGAGDPPRAGSRAERAAADKEAARERERGAWGSGGPTIPDVATALVAYSSSLEELDGEPASALVDYVNREGMDILVLASRGRGPVQKAMMGSTTEQVLMRAACACLVVKPQVGAGDTYRMKSAASSTTNGGALPQQPRSPAAAASPVAGPFARGAAASGAGPGFAMPFNRRVAIAYDTTASGRYLLKWAAETLLEPSDNIFVARSVPRVRRPGTSFADKASVQRLAGDALQGLPHVTTFNLPASQNNARRAVLDFVGKESVDMLVIGMYKGACKRKGIARRGNATAIYNRCGCPVMVVPMSEAALVVAVQAAELEAAAAEEAELATDDDSAEEDSGGEGDDGASPQVSPPRVPVSLQHPRAMLGSLADAARKPFGFMRRQSGGTDTAAGSLGGAPSPEPGARGAPRSSGAGPLGVALPLAGGALAAGRYVVEVDAAGAIRSIQPAPPGGGAPGTEGGSEAGGGNGGGAAAAAAAGGAGGARGRRTSAGSADGGAAAGGVAAGGAAAGGAAAGGGGAALAADVQARLEQQAAEIEELRAQLAQLAGSAGAGAGEAAAA